MRRVIWSTLAWSCLVAQFLPAMAQAGTFTFSPKPGDLWDLDHTKYYTWGISWTIPHGEYIARASLLIDNINDWQVEPDDILYIHLLDDPAVGVKSWNDNQGGGDAFEGQGLLLATYTDDDPRPNPPEDWSHDFTKQQVETLNKYAGNDLFGLGLDPDCHYYNDGIYLTLETVPEPNMALLGLLVMGLVVHARRRPAECR